MFFKFTNPNNIDEEYTVEYKGQLNDHVETMKSTTTEDGEQFAYRPFSKKNRCQGAKFGAGQCDEAFANDNFQLLDDGSKPFCLCKYCQFVLIGEEEAKNMPHTAHAPVPTVVHPGTEKLITVPLLDDNDESTGESMTFRCVGGCPNIIVEGIMSSGLSIVNLSSELGNPEQLSAALKALGETKKFWNTQSEGVVRSSPHLTTSIYESGNAPGMSGRKDTWSPTRKMLEEAHPPFKEIFKMIEKIHECKIHDGHMTLSLTEKIGILSRKIGVMDEHGDKPFKFKPLKRGILSVSDSTSDGMYKIMRFSDMQYGRWVDIEVKHGTFIEMDRFFSGTDSPRYIHGVRNANGVYTLVMDYGKEPSPEGKTEE